MKKQVLYILTLLATAFSPRADANMIDYSTMETLFGEPVTRGATGVVQKASEVPLNMQIITADEIKRSAARDLPEILRRVAGVNVQRSGFSSVDVNIRGMNEPFSQRLLVLVDGRQVYQNHYGYVDWNSIPVQLAEIKQIEVIKGPNTALYGFNATSGVINIITFNPKYDDVDSVQARYGTHNYAEGSLVSTLQYDKLAFRLSGNALHADESEGPYNDVAELSLREDDVLANNFKVDGIFQLGEDTQLGFEITESYNHNNAYSFFNVISDVKYDLNSFRTNLTHNSSLGMFEAMVYHNASNVMYDFPVAKTFVIPVEIEADLTVAKVSNTTTIGSNHTVRVTGEYRHNKSNIYPVDLEPSGESELRFTDYALSAVWNWKASDNVIVSTGARHDIVRLDRQGAAPPGLTQGDYDRTIEEPSVNVGATYTPTENDTIRVMYARGADLPTVSEFALLFPFGPTSFLLGNPRLDVSTADNYELNYERRLPSMNAVLKLAAFYQAIRDVQSLDDFTRDFPTPNTTIFRNTSDVDIIGGELELKGRIREHYQYGISYALAQATEDFLDTDNDGSVADEDPVQKYEGRSPEHQVNLHLGYAKDKLAADLFGNYISSFTQDRNEMDQEVNDLFLLSAKLIYDWNERFSTSLTGIGLLDANWRENPGLEAENQIFLTLDYRF